MGDNFESIRQAGECSPVVLMGKKLQICEESTEGSNIPANILTINDLMGGEGFISAYKPLQSKEIRNRIGKIPPKIPPSRIHWGYMAVAARRNRTLGRAVSYTACSRKGPFPNGRAMLSLK
jgi:hypothetical protein